MSSGLVASLRSIAQRSKIIPNARLAGLYEPVTQVVTVLSAKSDDLERAAHAPYPLLAAREYYTTVMHELTHWLDATGTLWGQRLLVAVHNAMMAHAMNRPEEFWRVAALEQMRNRGPASEFFATIDEPDAPVGKAFAWRWEVSCGLEFDASGRVNAERPIVFVSFHDAKSRLCRVPLTVLTLLEMNAMWSEFVTLSQVMQSLPDDVRVVEWPLASREMMAALYSSELGLYSAGAHLVASAAGVQRADIALRLASAMASVVLNLPASMYPLLNVPAIYREDWGERVDWLVERADPGFAFLLLCRAMLPFDDGDDVITWTDATLHRAGLPTAAEIHAAAGVEMSTLVGDLLNHGSWRARAEALLSIGRENFAARSALGLPTVSLDVLRPDSPYRLPPVILFDEAVIPASHHVVSHPLLDIELSIQLGKRYLAFEREFANACRA